MVKGLGLYLINIKTANYLQDLENNVKIFELLIS